ncbi:MAG TPA: hypothetical protein VK211_06545 [Kamptonema sp.]|nr:hypothetical protein [Kamptonema sp.]
MTYNSPEEYIEAMRTILNSGDFAGAQQLSFKAVEHYPDHAEIKKIARILAPSLVRVIKEPTDPKIWLNQEWIKQNRMQYRGNWVALKDGKLLAIGKNVDELAEQVGDIKEQRIFVTAIY